MVLLFTVISRIFFFDTTNSIIMVEIVQTLLFKYLSTMSNSMVNIGILFSTRNKQVPVPGVDGLTERN